MSSPETQVVELVPLMARATPADPYLGGRSSSIKVRGACFEIATVLEQLEDAGARLRELDHARRYVRRLDRLLASLAASVRVLTFATRNVNETDHRRSMLVSIDRQRAVSYRSAPGGSGVMQPNSDRKTRDGNSTPAEMARITKTMAKLAENHGKAHTSADAKRRS